MRNLRNTHHAIINFADYGEAAALTFTAWDGDDIICCLGPTLENQHITLKRLACDAQSPADATTIASWDSPSPRPDLDHDSVVDIHCMPDTGAICLVLQGGDIVVVREDPQPGQDLIEIVGTVDAGIAAAAWSPDGELLALATCTDTLLYMTRDFEPAASITFTEADLKVSNHVSVGWGKAETQFKGRGAKALRDPTVPEHVDEGKLSAEDDGRVTVSWRGDGEYLAVNSILDAAVRRRVIRVYSREGVLDSVSEPIDGLDSALSWKPSGQLIAVVQRLTDRIDIVFFERNGLRHGEFSLRLSPADLLSCARRIDLQWNFDSSVLSVAFEDRIQLWTMGNYHYYLKQEVKIPSSGLKPMPVNWHAEKALQLLVTSADEVHALEYQTHVARGPVAPPHDEGIVAVIDGRNLKITPLRRANVPPPMAFEEIELPSNAVDVAFDATGRSFAVLHQNCATLWTCDYGAKPPATTKLVGTKDLPDSDRVRSRQIALSASTQATILRARPNESRSTLTNLSFSESGPEISSVPDVLDEIRTLFTASNHDRLLAHAATGTIHEVDLESGLLSVSQTSGAGSGVHVAKIRDSMSSFGLSNNGVLQIHHGSQKLRIPGCTSFDIIPTHLVYTTSQHLLKFIHLHPGDLVVPPDEPESDERCRSIERGAKLVTIIPSAYSLVLQMPRGNLETIYPRALVLAGIRNALTIRNYKKAFSICRTHRVDMNILHDFAPEQFMADVELFVKQVKKIEYIDLFLSSLSEEDVSKTIYKDTIPDASGTASTGKLQAGANRPSGEENSKVNAICDAFLAVLSPEAASYLQSIVTCHVCKSPPDLASGLTLISDLRSAGDQTRLEQAVEHICFLADVNRLYDTALSLYDLEVALLIAQQSQKDPREYLPYLRSLQEMQPLRLRFTVDNDLKNYRKALTHLHAIGDFDEVKAFTQKHELYGVAIELYRYDNARLSELMRIHAEFLSSRNRYREAGIAYEYISDYAAAYEAYRAANMWRECLSTAACLHMAEADIAAVAHDLAEGLVEAKDFISAATIQLEYLHDLPTAAQLLCKGHRFADAIRQVVLHGKPELLKDVIDPGLVESSAAMTEMLAEMKTQLNAQVPRFQELRVKKVEDPMAFLDGGGAETADIPDDISLAPTNASTSGGTFMTRYTNRSTGTLATNATRQTSKNRRREERKRAKGKKGTVYEEEYLVNSIARLIERLHSVGDDIERLVEGLMRRAMRERAVAVDLAYREVAAACQACMGKVFGNVDSGTTGVAQQDQNTQQNEGAPAASRPWGGQGVLWESLTAAQQKREAPVLKVLERLSLLDTGM